MRASLGFGAVIGAIFGLWAAAYGAATVAGMASRGELPVLHLGAGR